VELKEIQAIPKVLLHDHVDGGLRPQTIIELARSIDFPLPSYIDTQLQEIIFQSCNEGSLEKYLKNFDYTIAVMQSYENLMRVARECVEDLAADGIVYAEVRGAPELFTAQGLSISDVIEATLTGLDEGMSEVRHQGKAITVRFITCAMRHTQRSLEVAELAVKYRERGVVGFDIAGPEDGFPPSDQLETFEYLRRENAHFTIHAGEAYGLPSIWEAIQLCGAERLGHGVRIIDDIDLNHTPARLGKLAAYVRDRRIPLEMCPSSNIQTGAATNFADHPIGDLAKLRFRVTVNTDNRLMSATSMTREMNELVKAFNWTFLDLQRVTINALKSAFIPFEERLAIIDEIIKPRFAKISAE